ncbi:MAG TPA: extracellular solute-binding protein [Elusimicrobiales bacterium]|nr:extracellular solute-binding protein [Elusimicrobiales bacterium]
MIIWLLADPDDGKFAAFRSLLNSFSEHYPDIKADFRVLTRRSMWRHLFAHLRDAKHRESADIVELPCSWTALFAKLGLLAEIEGVLEIFNRARYPEFLRKGFVPKGGEAAFSAPWWMEAPALFYRPEEFKRRGLRADEAPADWGGFMEACDRLSAANRRRGFYPVMHGPGGMGAAQAMPCLWNRGGGLFSEDMSRCTLSKDEAVRGLEDHLEPAIKGHLPLFSGSVLDGGAFYEDSTAMVIGTRPPSYPGRRSSFVPARLPGRREREQVLGYNLAVASSSDRLKEAGLFLKWALSPDNCRSFSAAFGVFPCLKPALDETLEHVRYGEVWRRIFSSPAEPAGTAVYPTAELLLDRALWHAELRIARQAWSREDFVKELIIAQGEIDYLLSLY